MTVGDRIKKIREENGMSQIDLARKTKISKQTLYKYENNVITNIPSDKIENISSILNCSPSYLMGWEDASSTVSFPLSQLEKQIVMEYRKADNLSKAMVLRSLGIDSAINEKETEKTG